jgi:hypothetical protein
MLFRIMDSYVLVSRVRFLDLELVWTLDAAFEDSDSSRASLVARSEISMFLDLPAGCSMKRNEACACMCTMFRSQQSFMVCFRLGWRPTV